MWTEGEMSFWVYASNYVQCINFVYSNFSDAVMIHRFAENTCQVNKISN